MTFRKTLVALAAAFGFGSSATAADIPCSTAKLIVPWGAGGDTDVVFRQVVEAANKGGATPQLQVINVPGQGGNKGAKQTVKAKPDGCTLFALHQSAITSYFTGRIDFTWDGFDPVAMLTRSTSIIGAGKNVPYDDLDGLIAHAKAHPGEITAGSTFGSVSQFVFLLIEDATGVQFKHVSYEGTKERMTALLAGNIEIGDMNLAAAEKYIETGELKALAVMSSERLTQLPDLKTAGEQGVDVVYGVERGIMLPKGTPTEIVDHYAALLEKAMQDPDLVATMTAKGTEIAYMGPQDYAAHLGATYDKWKAIAQKVGVYKRND